MKYVAVGEKDMREWGLGTPLHIGVYQRRWVGRVCYSRWDGKYWYVCTPFIEIAYATTDISCHQNLPWRGLFYRPTCPVAFK